MNVQASGGRLTDAACRRFAIRVDASTVMGTGHLMRCLTLAGRLRARGGSVHFISRDLPSSLAQAVVAQGHRLHALPRATESPGAGAALAHAEWLGASWQEDARQSVEIIESLGGVDVLVIDHYAVDQHWEGQLRPHVRWICAIDDLADRAHDCDVLFDQNHFADPVSRYEGRVPGGCRLLLGAGHALLRDEFLAERARLPQRSGDVRRVLVFYGGADPGNVTGRTLEALRPFMGAELAVDVAVGSLNPHIDALAAFCRDEPACQLHVQTAHMAELMAAADLAFGACGTASWERCALGLPALVMTLADNQVGPAQALAAAGAVVNLGDVGQVSAQDLAAAFLRLRDDPAVLQAMSDKALALMHTADAPIDAVLSEGLPFVFEDIALYPAMLGDAQALLQWRNQPEVRGNSRTSGLIDLEQHTRWLRGVLSDPHRHLLIARRGATPVGVLRLDEAGPDAEVSIYLCPGAHGQGNGSVMLRALEAWAAAMCPAVTRLLAEVLDDNAASHRLFRKNGYEWLATRYERRISR